MRGRHLGIAFLVVQALATASCQHSDYRPGSPFAPNPPATPGVAPVPFPVQSSYPPSPSPLAGGTPEPPPVSAGYYGYAPLPSTPSPGLAEQSQVVLGMPQPDQSPATPTVEAQLSPPQQAPSTPPSTAKPGPAGKSQAEPAGVLPVGIPQFTMARDGVASGLRPMLDGLDWLRRQGYRTVLHIRRPGEDDSSDRKQVEKRGMKYLSLEVSPATLSSTVVEEFARIVSDQQSAPLFVYDRDGVLAGGLWYLYFRTAFALGDEEARGRAASLGLRENGDGQQREMWLAVQNYLRRKQ